MIRTAARRTFAATGTNDRALLGVCSEISLAELAAILATTRLADDLKIQRALNLDGGSSSAFWFAREKWQRVFDSRAKTGARFCGEYASPIPNIRSSREIP